MFDFLRPNAPQDDAPESMDAPPALPPAPSVAPATPVAHTEPAQAPNVIGEGTRIGGPISTGGGLMIAGQIDGTVDCGGNLTLQSVGSIAGHITAQGDVLILGSVKGNIEAAGKLTIAPTGRVEGDVTARAIMLAEGGELSGRCSMGACAPTATRAADPSPEDSFLSKFVDDEDTFAPPLIAVPT